MSETKQRWTDPAKIARTVAIEVPQCVTEDGEPAVFEVKAVSIGELTVAMEGWPFRGRAPVMERTLQENLEILEKWQGPGARIAKLGVVGPPLAFEPGEAGFPWAELPLGARLAVVNFVLELSGISDRGAARVVRKFPGGGRAPRGAGGEVDGQAVEAGA